MVKKDSVVIKSSPYGLTLVLDREISFEQLVREICKKFATSRSFFPLRDVRSVLRKPRSSWRRSS